MILLLSFGLCVCRYQIGRDLREFGKWVMRNLFKSNRTQKKDDFITIVSGLPRSGTSMMMKMLEAGGISPMTDQLRTADEDNPKGYYEFERVKKMPDGDTAWLADAGGKAVKVISALLEHLPQGYTYKVIFMQRRIDEVLASQKQMLVRSDKPTDKVSDEKLAEMYGKHLAKIQSWLAAQPNFSVLYVDYNTMLSDPEVYAGQIARFLGDQVDNAKMVSVVDPSLYRQRK
jgi:hypothetical protein